jgi:hypothetical protein
MWRKNMQILFVDDSKLPRWYGLPEDTPHAKTAEDAIEMWQGGALYLDYDLGSGMDGAQLLYKMCMLNVRPT